MEEELWSCFCTILGLPPQANERSLTRKHLPQWDSLAHANLLRTLDARFGTDFASQPTKIHSFEDLKNNFNINQKPQKRRKSIKKVVFIGNCHAYLTYLSLIKKIPQQDMDLLYHNGAHILDFVHRNGNLDIHQRGLLFDKQLPTLCQAFGHYLANAQVICLNQIFQLEGPLNLKLAQALHKHFQPHKFFIQPMPLPPNWQDNHSAAQPYVGKQQLTEQMILDAGFHLIGSHKAMARFYEANGEWSFFTGFWSQNENRLDVTHPQPDFWDFYTNSEVLPALGLTHQEPSIPNSGNALAQIVNTIRLAKEKEAYLQDLNRLGINDTYTDEALKRLWYEFPNLRTAITLAALDRDQFPAFENLLTQVVWCDCNDLGLSPHLLEQLDHLLLKATQNFVDREAIRRCFLGFCLIYLLDEKATSKTSAFFEKNLFSEEFLFNGYQRFIAPIKEKQEGLSLKLHASGFQQLSKDLSKRINDSWMLYGAGPLAAYLILAAKEKPMAIISSYADQWGETLFGIAIISPEEAQRLTPNLIVIATRSRYYNEIRSLLTITFTSACRILPWFQENMTEDEYLLREGRTLAQSIYHAQKFQLIWIDAEGKNHSYHMKELLHWGHQICEPLDLKPGDFLPMILPTSPLVYALFYAGLVRGLVPSVLSYPTERRSLKDYRKQIDAVMKNLKANVLVCHKPLVKDLGGLCQIHPVTELIQAQPSSEMIEPTVSSYWAFLQHSSGTTGIQKAVPLSGAQVLAQVHAYGKALAITERDTIASWLPLYHDMGLITSLIGPPIWEATVVACDPVDWVNRPVKILEMIHDFRATLSWWPNFTFSFLAKTQAADLDLSCLRMLTNCAEPVTHASVAAFIEMAQPLGFKANAAASCYAMAETTFAVTTTRSGERAGRIQVNQKALTLGTVQLDPNGKILVSSGEALSISRVTILDGQQNPLPNDSVGEICIESASGFEAYYGMGPRGHESFCKYGYRTGDLGFFHKMDSGRLELFVTGRLKDMILIAGENHYPHEIEVAAEEIQGIKAGRSVAFGHFDETWQTESLIIAVESQEDQLSEIERENLKHKIMDKILSRFGLKVSYVVIYPPRSMIKSSSGKISRSASQTKILSDLNLS